MKHALNSLLAIALTGCSMFTSPERVPYYPEITGATYDNNETAVIETDNIFKSAIEQNRFIPVNDFGLINQVTDQVFVELENSPQFTYIDLQNALFHRGVESLIKQFSCELFASQQPRNSVQICPASEQIVDNNLGYLPFEQGTRAFHRLTVITRNQTNSQQLDFFLKSAHEKPLHSLWGAVHELGQFDGSTLAKDSLVLTTNLNGHKKDPTTGRWHEMYHYPLVFFVVLPSVEQIINRPDEVEAMDFAYRSAKLLVVDSR